MVFHSSPTLRRIRQLARLIRRNPDLPIPSWTTHRNAARCSRSDQTNAALPDPDAFVDSSVSNAVPEGLPDRKHAYCPRSRAGR